MSNLSSADRVLGWILGLGDLHGEPACMGYANACVCLECVERAAFPLAPEPVKQPWEAKAA